jgi:flavin reductase (DIM6/NTAB) family NADH-FMN oxidoreductase RutF
MECDLQDSVEFGTYDLFIGRVASVTHRENTGVLTYFDSAFGTHVPAEQIGA